VALLLCALLLCALPALAQDTTRRVNLPLVVKGSTAPQASMSYYITEVANLPRFKLKGCVSAVDLQQKEIPYGLIAFFYGRPAYRQGHPNEPGVYGTTSVDGSFISLEEIKESAQLWMQGFIQGFHDPESAYDCGLRIDAKIGQPWVKFVVATTNEPLSIELPLNQISATAPKVVGVSLEGHGQAWGTLINELRAYVEQQGWEHIIRIEVGNDMEIGFNSPEETKKWVNGYKSTALYPYYHLGDCAGCPNPLPWTLQDLWDVTANVNSPNIPQIYRTDGDMALRWGQALRILRDTPDPHGDFPDSHLKPLIPQGVLTQHKACDDKGVGKVPPVSGAEICFDRGSSFYNTPQQGWDQFADALINQRLPPTPYWLTDIGYNWDYSAFHKPTR
jgi:hypothetical protein